MTPLWLRIQAPFAAFRWLQAGPFRGSWPVMPPSALWGLLLNLASIEARTDPRPLRLAFGELRKPSSAVLYQNLHIYTVGNKDQEARKANHGLKSFITPGKREILQGLDFVVGAQGDPDLLTRIQDGLAGKLPRTRLPFLGENNYLIDQIEVLSGPPSGVVRWLARPSSEPHNTVRLTVNVDRADTTKTTRVVLQPIEADEPPESAWVWVPRDP